MSHRICVFRLAVVVALVAGCQNEEPPATGPAPTAVAPSDAEASGAAPTTPDGDTADASASDDRSSENDAPPGGRHDDEPPAAENLADTETPDTETPDTETPDTETPDDEGHSGEPTTDSGAASDAAAQSVGDQADEFSAELFHRWPKPQVAIVLSGEQDGYFEPCGCAGLENQKGGLSRRHTFLEQLRGDGWEVVPLDLGGLVNRYGRQTEIKYHVTVEALHTMGYAAVGFGPQDLRLPAGELEADALLETSAFVSANVNVWGAVPPLRIVEAAGRKLGITAVLGAHHWGQVNNDDLTFRAAEEALAEATPRLEKEADFLILLAYATPQESAELARKFPQFDLVVTAGGADEPPPQSKRVDGSGPWLVEVGHKGMFVNVVGLFDEDEQPLRFQAVPLDRRFADSPAMHEALVAYQGQLQEHGWQGLQVKALKHPSGLEFVGSQACGECHTKAFASWSDTPHAHATQTLVDLDPPRHYDPECVSCHSTGWQPQQYVPFASGFDSLETTPLLAANGCENCHGPGSSHARAENEATLPDDEMKRLRASMRLPLAEAAQSCEACHDHDNSPDFERLGFDHYWQEVEHRGKD